MRDYLLDLVKHTIDLGPLDTIRIDGDHETTKISGVGAEKLFVVQGEFKAPVAEFVGTFGMPGLAKLKILLNLEEYKENSKLSISHRADNGSPEMINFENANGDFYNSYRLMASNVVEDKLPRGKFLGAKWVFEFTPSVASIMRLKMQAQANSGDSNFQIKTEDGHLKFFFGDHATTTGNFIFQNDIGSVKLNHTWAFPVSVFESILSISGDKTMHISDDGVAKITVDSGLAKYEYIILAQTK
jgi:hypothetical protein